MAVSKRLRYEVFRRDGFRCRYCGAGPDDAKLTVDHVVPDALGGETKPENLVTACADCNAGKTSTVPDAPVVENVSDDALRWAEALKKAAEVQAADRKGRRKYVRAFKRAWNEWVIDTSGDEPLHFDLPNDWESSVGRFHDAGLGIGELTEAVDLAMQARVQGTRKFRYFCGVCWNKIRDRQRIAADLIASEEGE